MFRPGKSLQAIETRTAGKEMRVIPFKLFIGYLEKREKKKQRGCRKSKRRIH
jgi:hypothetical protein